MIRCSTARWMLVLSPPHRPLSVVTRMMPTALIDSRFCRNGGRYSGFASARCATMLRILSPYGRNWRIRSCALRIFEAATISIALVILRVFCTLLIFRRISLVPAMSTFGMYRRFAPHVHPGSVRCSSLGTARRSNTFQLRIIPARLLEAFDRLFELGLVVLRQILRAFDALDQRGVLGLDVIAQRFFGRQAVLDIDAVERARR